MDEKTLYQRLGGYDALNAMVEILLPRMMADAQLSRFWRYRASDTLARERQLLVDYLASACGGPVRYQGRSLRLSHQGLEIDASDWQVFIGHLRITLEQLGVAAEEARDVLTFIESTRKEVVL